MNTIMSDDKKIKIEYDIMELSLTSNSGNYGLKILLNGEHYEGITGDEKSILENFIKTIKFVMICEFKQLDTVLSSMYHCFTIDEIIKLRFGSQPNCHDNRGG
jgi:hypothetical protein